MESPADPPRLWESRSADRAVACARWASRFIVCVCVCAGTLKNSCPVKRQRLLCSGETLRLSVLGAPTGFWISHQVRAYHEPSVLSVWTAGRRSRSRSDLLNGVSGVGGVWGWTQGAIRWEPLPQGRALALSSRLALSSCEGRGGRVGRKKHGIPAEAVRTCFGTMEVILNLVTADASPLSPPSAVSPHLHTHTHTHLSCDYRHDFLLLIDSVLSSGFIGSI